MDLALFDFDGTVDPTYPAFVRFAVRRSRKLLGGFVLTPLILGYRRIAFGSSDSAGDF